jgi:hypothetical protein
VLTHVNLCAYPGEHMCLPRGTYVLAQVLAKGKQFMLLIRHPMCYSYIYIYIFSSPVNILSVMEEIKNIYAKRTIVM